MLSFHNDPAVKAFYVKRMADHLAADEVRQNYGYWEDGKGCSVGCTIHSGDHSAYEREDGPGLPEWLALLQDALFEGLTPAAAMEFTAHFFPAIPVGVDLDPVKWRFCAFLMRENLERVSALDIDASLKQKVLSAVQQVLALLERTLATGACDLAAAESARSAAESARSVAWSAASAASSAAHAAAESAVWSVESARSVAWSVARSARSAWSVESAWSAAESVAWSAWSAKSAWSVAESAAYKRYADQLLALLQAA